MLRARNDNSNYFEVEIPIIFRRYFLLDKETYLANRPIKPKQETKKFVPPVFSSLWMRLARAKPLNFTETRRKLACRFK